VAIFEFRRPFFCFNRFDIGDCRQFGTAAAIACLSKEKSQFLAASKDVPQLGENLMSKKFTFRMVRSACVLFAAVAAMTFLTGNANAQGCGYGGGGGYGGYGGHGGHGISVGIGGGGYNYNRGLNVGYSSFRPSYGGGWQNHHFNHRQNFNVPHRGHYGHHRNGHWNH
jgi:hypothetical protein